MQGRRVHQEDVAGLAGDLLHAARHAIHLRLRIHEARGAVLAFGRRRHQFAEPRVLRREPGSDFGGVEVVFRPLSDPGDQPMRARGHEGPAPTAGERRQQDEDARDGLAEPARIGGQVQAPFFAGTCQG